MTEKLIDEENKILSRVSNRDNSTHFFTHEADLTDQYYSGRWEISNQDYLAFVLDYDKESKLCTIAQRNYFSTGDKVLIFTPDGQRILHVVDKLYNEDMEEVEKANHAEEVLYFNIDKEIPYASMIRRVYEWIKWI